MSTQQHHPLAKAVEKAFTGEAISQFNQQGFCVLKNALKDEEAQTYLDDLLTAFEPTKNNSTSNKNPFGRFEPNKVEFLLASGPIQLVKPNVYECDMHKSEQRKGLSSFENVFTGHGENDREGQNGDADQIANIINERLPEMGLLTSKHAKDGSEEENNQSGSIAQHITLKLQVNKGGAFPLHHDNPGVPNKRKLTLALYLTKDWKKETHGGELVFQPFLGEQVVVPPAFNTLVLFRSDLASHRVFPAKPGSTRYCFTIWFDSSKTNSDEEVNLRAKHLTPEFMPTLKTSPIHRSLMRAVYDEEMRASLKDCFGEGTREYMISVKMHEAHVAPLMKNPAVANFIKLLKEEKVKAM